MPLPPHSLLFDLGSGGSPLLIFEADEINKVSFRGISLIPVASALTPPSAEPSPAVDVPAVTRVLSVLGVPEGYDQGRGRVSVYTSPLARSGSAHRAP